ncbi:MAG TPA: hypothetical protein VFL83_14945 [Anaeromyxobacter sp.]|nr:hypothetical protein [Anaeromyxobacter sp.]
MTRRIVPFVAAALLAAPQAARAAVSLEVFYGLSRPESASFSQAASGTANDPDLLASSLNVAGGDVLFHLGLFEIGGIIDTSWKSGSASQTAIGALVGVGGDMGGWLRLEALGELGAQRYGNFAENPNVVTSGSSNEWFMYVGLRPGVAVRMPVGQGNTAVLVGLWAFARWDLNSSTVPVTVGDADSASPGTLELGGTTIGAQLRLGLDF